MTTYDADRIKGGEIEAPIVKVNGKQLYIQATAPSNPDTDDVWIDIS